MTWNWKEFLEEKARERGRKLRETNKKREGTKKRKRRERRVLAVSL